jgi:sugar lactone lactonase YvrE
MRRIATALGLAGALVALIIPASAGAASTFGPNSTIFGGSGNGTGQFNHPQGAVTDSSGRVYVVDAANNRIERFDSSGNFQTSFAATGDFSPQDIAIGPPSESIYVSSLHRVDVWNNALTVHSKFSPSNIALGTGTGYGIAVDGSGTVYVSDSQNSVIHKYVLTLPAGDFSGQGSGPGQLLQPQGMTTDSAGNVYVADPSNGRIEKFSSGGTFLGQWSMPAYTVVANGSTFAGVVHPQDVAVDTGGRVFAPDTGTHSNLVAVFGAGGDLQQEFGSPDSDPGNPCTLRGPWGLSTSPSGALYVVSTGEDSVRVFDESSTTCPSPNFGSAGSGPGGGPGGAPANAANDTAKPVVKMTGFPRKCARRDFIFTVHAQDDVLISRLALYVNRRRATNDEIDQQQFEFRVHIPVRRVRREIPRGFVVRVLIAVKATDLAGHKTVARKTFSICG